MHLRALRELVERLEKQKYAATDNPRQRGTQREAGDPRQRSAGDPRQSGGDTPTNDNPRQRGTKREATPPSDYPRQRGTIPAAIRRAVRERDGARCTFVDERGQRCRETALLEFHHEQPFVHGGPATAANLHLRCRAHNALAAERDFGRGFVQKRKPAAPDG